MSTRIAITLALFFAACAPETEGPVDFVADPAAEQTTNEQPPTTSEPSAPATEPDPAETPVDPPAATEAPADPWHGSLGEPTTVDLVAENADAFVRVRRRMDIGQLSTAIERATGGIAWTDNKGNDRFEQLASTLGRPNYINTVNEDLSPGPVFQKFLGDAARAVCTELADAEPDLPADQRVLMVHAGPEDTIVSNPGAVGANLSMLLLRFHGVSAVGDDPALARWRWLFQSVTHVTSNPVQGWRAVCIALIEHPDFYSY